MNGLKFRLATSSDRPRAGSEFEEQRTMVRDFGSLDHLEDPHPAKSSKCDTELSFMRAGA